MMPAQSASSSTCSRNSPAWEAVQKGASCSLRPAAKGRWASMKASMSAGSEGRPSWLNRLVIECRLPSMSELPARVKVIGDGPWYLYPFGLGRSGSTLRAVDGDLDPVGLSRRLGLHLAHALGLHLRVIELELVGQVVAYDHGLRLGQDQVLVVLTHKAGEGLDDHQAEGVLLEVDAHLIEPLLVLELDGGRFFEQVAGGQQECLHGQARRQGLDLPLRQVRGVQVAPVLEI